MYRYNTEEIRNKEFIHYLHKLYNSGCLLRQNDWSYLLEIADKIDKLKNRSNYLKTEALVEHFISDEIEEFIMLSTNYSTLLSTSINVIDYLKNKTVDDKTVFESDEEALECLEKAFIDIQKIKEDNENYLTKEFED